MAHTFSPSTQEAEAGGFLSSSQPGLQSEFQDSQGYTEKPCLKKNKKTQRNKTKQKQTNKQRTTKQQKESFIIAASTITGHFQTLEPIEEGLFC